MIFIPLPTHEPFGFVFRGPIPSIIGPKGIVPVARPNPADSANSNESNKPQDNGQGNAAVDRLLSNLLPFFLELMRRSIDGTVVPIFVDYTNSRVIIGGITASASPAKFEIASGDIKVVSGGSGIILATRDGTKFGRLVLENADANGNLQLSVDPL